MGDYLPLIVMVSVIVGAIIALRVFFTLWGPVDRRFNGGKFLAGKPVNIDELKNKRVNVRLKNNEVITGIALLGFSSTHPQAHWLLRQLLLAQYADGRMVYIRLEEITYFEAEKSPA